MILEIKVIEIVGDRATDMKQGDQIYTLLKEGFAKGEVVVLDFKDMVTVLSTFLNNAIGTLYKDYTSDFLNSNLKIVNLNDDDMFILRRVIKRAKEFYSNEKELTKVLDENFSD